MRSIIANGLMLILFLCGTTLAAEAPGLQKISDHVYALVDCKDPSPSANSFGANSGVVIGRDGVLVIDTLVSAKEGKRLLADIRKMTDKPVKFVVNTHYHLDHAFGNCVFADLGSVIITQENTRDMLAAAAYGLAHYTDYTLTAKDMEGTTLVQPTLYFSDRLTVNLGDVTVELTYLGPSHTKDSIFAYIPNDKVLFTGDIMFTRYHPFLGDGNLANWPKVLDDLTKIDAVAIIPGHGPISTKKDLKEMKDYILAFEAKAPALCKGKTAGDAPAIAKELIKLLPDQQRTLLPVMVESNLQLLYLPKPQTKQ